MKHLMLVLTLVFVILTVIACSPATPAPTAPAQPPGQGTQPPKVQPTLAEPPAQAKTSPQPATQPTATQTPNNKLLGMWIGRVADGTNATLVFREDGQVWSVNSGKATRTEIFAYTVDFSFKPAHLDTRDSSGKTSSTIIEFVDENTIRVANVSSSPQGRPTSFGSDTLTFKRNSATPAPTLPPLQPTAVQKTTVASPQPTAQRTASPISNSKILGTWIGKAGSTTNTITFKENGQMSMTSGSSTATGTYTIDFSAKPAHLDMDGSWTGGKKVTTILEFIDNNQIRVENISPGQSRPTAFGDKAITLTRQ